MRSLVSLKVHEVSRFCLLEGEISCQSVVIIVTVCTQCYITTVVITYDMLYDGTMEDTHTSCKQNPRLLKMIGT